MSALSASSAVGGREGAGGRAKGVAGADLGARRGRGGDEAGNGSGAE